VADQVLMLLLTLQLLQPLSLPLTLQSMMLIAQHWHLIRCQC